MGKTVLGIDLGSSSVKASIIDADNGSVISSGQSPDYEMAISAPHQGWAEQDPEMWWEHVKNAVREALTNGQLEGSSIEAIGIAYQMHGLVAVNKDMKPVRPSIIWCDSRATSIGDVAFHELGEDFVLTHYLNSPGAVS